jgi:hypothetical protein
MPVLQKVLRKFHVNNSGANCGYELSQSEEDRSVGQFGRFELSASGRCQRK